MAVIRTFGRREEFDTQSRAFPIRALIPRGTVPRSYTWRCDVTLDQGSTSACTGFSVAQEAAARPVVVPGITNLIGRSLYARAKQLDQWPGEAYEGSSVLAAIKAGAEKGWYPAYRWAFGERDLCLAVGYSGPAVLGIPWYEGLSQPDASGLVKVTGRVQGGHAILCTGFNVKTKLYRLHNSWGPGWGKNGECFISAADLARLLSERGEACIPVKRHM